MKNFLERHIGKIVYASGLVILVVVFLSVQSITNPFGRYVEIVEHFAFAAIAYIYLMVLLNPLLVLFGDFPGKNLYLKARHPLGLVGLFFGFFHGGFAFFKLLGGPSGVAALESKYLLAVILAISALLIFTFLGISTFFWKKFRLSPWSYRLGYLGDIFIVIHAVIIGSDFQDLNITSKALGLALFVLVVLEIARVIKSLFYSPKS